jgi:DNA repair exonuclease SbcCD ATPase subunit
MIEDTIKKIETKIQTATAITSENKAELLSLLSALESEITRLSKAESEHAESIAGFIERSAHEATRQEKNPELLRLSLAGLAASVKGFEASHPRLVEDINYISTVLANMGI